MFLGAQPCPHHTRAGWGSSISKFLGPPYLHLYGMTKNNQIQHFNMWAHFQGQIQPLSQEAGCHIPCDHIHNQPCAQQHQSWIHACLTQRTSCQNVQILQGKFGVQGFRLGSAVYIANFGTVVYMASHRTSFNSRHIATHYDQGFLVCVLCTPHFHATRQRNYTFYSR